MYTNECYVTSQRVYTSHTVHVYPFDVWCTLRCGSLTLHMIDNSNSTILLWEGTVFSWKYNQSIIIKLDRVLCYNNEAAKHDSQPVFAIPVSYLQKSNHRVLTSTCSLSLAFHFHNSTTQLSSSASKSSWTCWNQLVWDVDNKNQLSGSAFVISMYQFTFLIFFASISA